MENGLLLCPVENCKYLCEDGTCALGDECDFYHVDMSVFPGRQLNFMEG